MEEKVLEAEDAVDALEEVDKLGEDDDIMRGRDEVSWGNRPAVWGRGVLRCGACGGGPDSVLLGGVFFWGQGREGFFGGPWGRS